jgi:hypothetical protein
VPVVDKVLASTGISPFRENYGTFAFASDAAKTNSSDEDTVTSKRDLPLGAIDL